MIQLRQPTAHGGQGRRVQRGELVEQRAAVRVQTARPSGRADGEVEDAVLASDPGEDSAVDPREQAELLKHEEAGTVAGQGRLVDSELLHHLQSWASKATRYLPVSVM